MVRSTCCKPRAIPSTASRRAPKVHGLTFSPDGSAMAAGDWSGGLTLWDLETWQVTETYEHRSSIVDLEFHPTGASLLVAGEQGMLESRVLDSGDPPTPWPGHAPVVTAVSFHPDGHLAASACFDGTLKIWSASTGTEIGTLAVLESRAYDIEFSAGGEWLAALSWEDALIYLWHAPAVQSWAGSQR